MYAYLVAGGVACLPYHLPAMLLSSSAHSSSTLDWHFDPHNPSFVGLPTTRKFPRRRISAGTCTLSTQQSETQSPIRAAVAVQSFPCNLVYTPARQHHALASSEANIPT